MIFTSFWKFEFCTKKCYVVVNLLNEGLLKEVYVRSENYEIYSNSGDDGKEDPPVPIPNTEVKLFNAESTCG